MTTTELLTAEPATDTPRRRRGAASRSVTLPVRLATVLLAVSTLAPSGQTEGAAELPPQASTTIDALLPSWRSRVEWALERFAMAGLPLPPIEITVHRHTRLCDGNSGLFRPGPPVEVHVCSIGDADTRAARLITLHELAHAWAETYLEPERRSTFLDLRGLEAWVDPDLPAHEWGAEHAAEVVSWGLMDASVQLIRIDDTDPASLTAAFELLVGRAPLWDDASATEDPTVVG